MEQWPRSKAGVWRGRGAYSVLSVCRAMQALFTYTSFCATHCTENNLAARNADEVKEIVHGTYTGTFKGTWY